MSSSPPLVVADRYRLVAPLGQGGMGRVWRANDVVLHRDVAIKELVPPPGLTAGERQEMRERSLREARAIARLNNINVVRVFDVLRTDADPWIVMEYVPSRSLQDTLAADGPFSPVRAAEMGLGVLGALRAAHRAGVVHRDVKPGNVLIGEDGRVVLTDFGLATVPGDPNVTRTGLVLGSPAYIAPERAREGTAGPAADLWSLGATLYAAVEGASPFARPSAIATLAALATENPPPARNAGPLKPVLNGLLRKDPTHRINAEETERLLLRAAGKKSRMTFPMSPTMRRPGVGRERPALPSPPGGVFSSTGGAPVVPGPRVAPTRPPGQPPVVAGHPAAGDSRPPVYVPGKASVGRPAADKPTRVDTPKVEAPKIDAPKAETPRLDATRVDTPPVRDDQTRVDTPPVRDDQTKLFGTGPASTTAPGQSPTPEKPRPAPAQDTSLTRTSRGEVGAFTAADVAAHRRKQFAPEHEKSLRDATALVGKVETPTPPTKEQPSAPAEARAAAPTTESMAAAPVTEPMAAATPPTATSPSTATPATTAAPTTATLPAAPAAAPAAAGTASSEQAAEALATTVTDEAPAAPGTDRDAQPTPGTDQAAHPTTEQAALATTEPAIPATTSQAAASATEEAASVVDKATSATDEAASVTAKAASATTDQATTAPAAAAAMASAPGLTDPGTTVLPAQPTRTSARPKPSKSPKRSKAAAAKQAAVAPATPKAVEPGSPAAPIEPDQTRLDQIRLDQSKPGQTEPDQTKPDRAKPESAELDQAGTKPTELAPTEAKPTAAESSEKQAEKQAEKPAEPAVRPTPVDEPAKTAVVRPSPTKKAPATTTKNKDDVPAIAPISPVINRPSRPAWRPMDVQPTPTRGGVTVFGTRLTYRQAAIGAGILLLILVLVITLVAQAFGRDDNKAAAPTGPTAAPTAAASQAATQPSPTQPSATKETSSAPPTSASPTPSKTSAPAPGLPAGWELRTVKATSSAPAFVIALPKDAKQSGGGPEIHYRWNNRLLIVGRTKDAQPDAYKDWKNQSKNPNKSDYHLISLKPVSWRGFKSVADWEFTYRTGNSTQHVVKRNIAVSAKAAYSLNWYVATDDWGASQSDLQAIYQGFQPK